MGSPTRTVPALYPAGLSGRSGAAGPGLASNAPLPGLAGSGLAGRFRHWHGASGRRYLFSVYPFLGADLPALFEDAVVLAVRRGPGSERAVLHADETAVLPELYYANALFQDALRRGVNEIHVHLLTDDGAVRAAIVRDLRPAGVAGAPA